jgi:hypothetical protein
MVADMTTVEPARLMPSLWKAAVASGVLAVVLGVLILLWPDITILVASVLFGVYLLVIGCAQLFFAFTLDVSAAGRILLTISGAAALVVAILSFRHFGEDYAVLLLAGIVVLAAPLTSIVTLAIARPGSRGCTRRRRGRDRGQAHLRFRLTEGQAGQVARNEKARDPAGTDAGAGEQRMAAASSAAPRRPVERTPLYFLDQHCIAAARLGVGRDQR